jgi:CRISPR-associated protein Cst2
MARHLFGIICTHHGTAANNRAETEGNITTLQKILWNGAVHSTVSAEAIRWALRYGWQRKGLTTNRQWQDELNRHEWRDPDFQRGAVEFIDDDVLGYMSARAAQAEANAEEGGGRRRGRARGTTDARRARLEVTRAISLTPWAGDITFNAASINATPSAALQGMFPVPYGTEVHATRYQYGFALTPTELAVPRRALDVVDGLMQLDDVAGNHARFLFDFSPESVIFRWTDDFAPRMLYAFREENGAVRAPMVVERVRAGDIRADELIVGGAISATVDGQALRELGATVHAGVRAAAEDVKQRLAAYLNTSEAR